MKIIVEYKKRYDYCEGVSYWFPNEEYEFEQNGESLLGDQMHQSVIYESGWAYLDSAKTSDSMRYAKKINGGNIDYKIMELDCPPPIFKIDDPDFEKIENFC